ncbi:probable MPN domain-containing protein [Coccomyxa sp. Obi]|nr:probable MPN domain-containing protein [Coccomyxa sp. Obi]
MAEYASTKLLLSTSRSGPFISGVSHSILSLGQRPPLGALSDEEDEDDPYSPETRKGNSGSAANSSGQRGRGRGRGGGSAKRARGGTLTLQDLMDAGIIFPGRNNISVHYKGTVYTASLGKDGMILYQGKKFQSATSFSIHCKRMQTPNKQGDDGWKSVLYEGQPLEVYRKRHASKQPPVTPRAASRRPAASSEEGADEEMPDAEDTGTAAGAAAAAAAAEAAVEPATDQWVQCDRCRTWRIVPDQHWPAVEADPRDVWYCEYATWNLALVAPFKEACGV